MSDLDAFYGQDHQQFDECEGYLDGAYRVIPACQDDRAPRLFPAPRCVLFAKYLQPGKLNSKRLLQALRLKADERYS